MKVLLLLLFLPTALLGLDETKVNDCRDSPFIAAHTIAPIPIGQSLVAIGSDAKLQRVIQGSQSEYVAYFTARESSTITWVTQQGGTNAFGPCDGPFSAVALNKTSNLICTGNWCGIHNPWGEIAAEPQHLKGDVELPDLRAGHWVDEQGCLVVISHGKLIRLCVQDDVMLSIPLAHPLPKAQKLLMITSDSRKLFLFYGRNTNVGLTLTRILSIPCEKISSTTRPEDFTLVWTKRMQNARDRASKIPQLPELSPIQPIPLQRVSFTLGLREGELILTAWSPGFDTVTRSICLLGGINPDEPIDFEQGDMPQLITYRYSPIDHSITRNALLLSTAARAQLFSPVTNQTMTIFSHSISFALLAVIAFISALIP